MPCPVEKKKLHLSCLENRVLTFFFGFFFTLRPFVPLSLALRSRFSSSLLFVLGCLGVLGLLSTTPSMKLAMSVVLGLLSTTPPVKQGGEDEEEGEGRMPFSLSPPSSPATPSTLHRREGREGW